MKYGLIPEIVGRLPVLVTLEDLSREALIDILTKPKNSLVRQYTRLLEFDGVELEVTDDAIGAIADKALERKTGARGLRGIMEKLMTNVMYELPSRKDVKKCIITKETVEKGSDPELILEDLKELEGKEQKQEQEQ